MNNFKKLSTLILTVTLLMACQAQEESVEDSSSTSQQESSTQQVESTSKEKESTEEKEPVIEMTEEEKKATYQPAIDKILADASEFSDRKAPDYYTFIDINDDGYDEFLTAFDTEEKGILVSPGREQH